VGAAQHFRAGVVIVVRHPDGKQLLAFERSDSPDSWQLPQGGLDTGEEPIEGAWRELFEETGVRSVTLLDRTPGWITYDFPPDLGGPRAKWGHKGQKQVWFAYRFTGRDAEIDLAAHGEQEFDAAVWEEGWEESHALSER
jgi:putative (di)nucleoside polyphosphate hydrolase